MKTNANQLPPTETDAPVSILEVEPGDAIWLGDAPTRPWAGYEPGQGRWWGVISVTPTNGCTIAVECTYTVGSKRYDCTAYIEKSFKIIRSETGLRGWTDGREADAVRAAAGL